MRCCISRTSPGFTLSFLAMAPSLAFCMSPVTPSNFSSSRRVRAREKNSFRCACVVPSFTRLQLLRM